VLYSVTMRRVALGLVVLVSCGRSTEPAPALSPPPGAPAASTDRSTAPPPPASAENADAGRKVLVLDEGVTDPAPTGVPDAARTVAAFRPRARRCYASALDRVPGLEASYLFTLRVEVNGQVASVSVLNKGATSDAGLESCLRVALTSLKFSPPASASEVAIPRVFKAGP
jgi:hypothetical protein